MASGVNHNLIIAMIANIDWDTGMVLTIILAPLSIGLFVLCLTQWQRINELKNDKETAVAKANKLQQMVDASPAEFASRLANASAQKDAEIQRQKEDIVELHRDLNLANTHLDCYRMDATRHDEQLREARRSVTDSGLPGASCL